MKIYILTFLASYLYCCSWCWRVLFIFSVMKYFFIHKYIFLLFIYLFIHFAVCTAIKRECKVSDSRSFRFKVAFCSLRSNKQKWQRSSEHLLNLFIGPLMQPSVGKGFKCSQCPPSEMRLHGQFKWFSAFVIADFLHNLLVSFMLFGVR